MDRLRRSLARKVQTPLPWSERKQLLEPCVSAIIERIKPFAIYAFGSIVTDKFDDESDFDLLVICSPNREFGREWKERRYIRPHSSRPLDLIFMSFDDFQRKKESGGVAMVAVLEGKLIYQCEIARDG